MSKTILSALQQLKEDIKVHNITCPECNSKSVIYINKEDSTNPSDNNLDITAKEHITRKHYLCSDCGASFNIFTKTVVITGIEEDNYTSPEECHRCHKYFPEDDMYTDEDGNGIYCSNCIDEI